MRFIAILLAAMFLLVGAPRTVTAQPAAPTLVSPGTSSAPGPTISTLTPTMQWQASAGATGYGLYISIGPAFTILAYENEGIGAQTSIVLPAGTLQTGQQYRWNMRARNALGWGAFSSRLYFQTVCSVPDAPALLSPGSSASPGPVISTLTPTMQWQASAGATGYGLYISIGPAFTTLVYNNDNVPNVTSLILPSGILQTGQQYRWNMRAQNPCGWSGFTSPFYFQTQGSTFVLSFPLPNRTPFTAAINSVFDHAMASPYTANGVVVAYTGERGESQYGQLLAATVNGVPLYGFRQASGANFIVNGNYTGAGQPNYLWYDGHPGIDYRTTDQSPNGQINALAAADGTLHKILGSPYNTVYIDHLNGYTTHYLHLSNPNLVPDNTPVTRGQVIGITGDAGAPGSPHLHFEVKLNGIEVDPYGWTGSGPDPYTRATNTNLWNGAPPCYANCDGSTTAPILNVLDFQCFLNRFAAADPYANCDNSTTPPILNVNDFNCFLNRFAAGCP